VRGGTSTTALPLRRRGRTPVDLPSPLATAFDTYISALAAAPLAGTDGRDWAVRDYRTHLQAVLKRSPATINNALAAVDDLYLRLGLGPAALRAA
jgi:hypothetical protein